MELRHLRPGGGPGGGRARRRGASGRGEPMVGEFRPDSLGTSGMGGSCTDPPTENAAIAGSDMPARHGVSSASSGASNCKLTETVGR